MVPRKADFCGQNKLSIVRERAAGAEGKVCQGAPNIWRNLAIFTLNHASDIS